MTSTNSMYDNGSMAKSPRLSREKFIIRKNRIMAFLIGVDNVLLNTIKEGLYIPTIFIIGTPASDGASATKDRYQVKERDLSSDEAKKKVFMDGKARSNGSP